MIKINSENPIKKQIDCPYCYSLLEWDSGEDLTTVNGNQYIICPECGQMIQLNPKQDYIPKKKVINPDGDEIQAYVVEQFPSTGEDGKYYILKTNQYEGFVYTGGSYQNIKNLLIYIFGEGEDVEISFVENWPSQPIIDGVYYMMPDTTPGSIVSFRAYKNNEIVQQGTATIVEQLPSTSENFTYYVMNVTTEELYKYYNNNFNRVEEPLKTLKVIFNVQNINDPSEKGYDRPINFIPPSIQSPNHFAYL